MALRSLAKLGAAVAVGTAAVVMVATAAWANTTPSLIAGQTGKDIAANDQTFNKAGQSDCDGVTHSATQDGWVFNWPGNNAGDLVHVNIGFDTDGNHTADAFKTEADGTKTTDNGTLKFVIITPHGWLLESGTSEITGTTPQNDFVLTHTCAGTETPPTTTTSSSSSSS